MDLNQAWHFVQVVDKGGYSAAARVLGVPKSRLSRQVKALEEALAVRLLNRDSRRMSLTGAGEAYLRHARMALECMEAAEAAVRGGGRALQGAVVLSCSVGVAQYALGPLLPRFLAAHPGVVLRLHASNAFADLVGDGVDLAVRGHRRLLPDSGLIQRRIARVPWHLYGAPDLARRLGDGDGDGAGPEALEGLPGLALGWRPGGDAWSLEGPGGRSASVPYPARMRSDDMQSLMQAAAAGLGVTALPGYVCAEAEAAGRLARLLPGWTAGSPEISLLSHARRGVPPQVEALATFLLRELPGALDAPVPPAHHP